MSEVQALVPAGWVDSRLWATLLGQHGRAEWSRDVHFWFWSLQHHFYWLTHRPVLYLLRETLAEASMEARHKPLLHYQVCPWQACDDESSMVRWGPSLITAVIYRIHWPQQTRGGLLWRTGLRFPVIQECISLLSSTKSGTEVKLQFKQQRKKKLVLPSMLISKNCFTRSDFFVVAFLNFK